MEIGIVGDARAVAALGSEKRRVDRRNLVGRLAARLGCLGFPDRDGLLVGVGLVDRLDRRSLNVRGPNHELGRVELRRQYGLAVVVRLRAGAHRAHAARRLGRRATDARCDLLRRAAQGTARPGHPRTGGADHSRQRRAGYEDQPSREQEGRQDARAERRDQMRGDPQLPLADDAASGLERAGAPELAAVQRPRAETERARRKGQRDRGREA